MNIYDKIIITNIILALFAFWFESKMESPREFQLNDAAWTYVFSSWIVGSILLTLGWIISLAWRFF